MIVFNGLYFNGVWKTPFQLKQGEEPFYTVNNEKIMTKMMYSVGEFRVGRIPELEGTAVCLPYKVRISNTNILLRWVQQALNIN